MKRQRSSPPGEAPPSRERRSPASSKTRLDTLLVARGLAETRERAQALIASGLVTVTGPGTATMPGLQVRPDVEITIAPSPMFVSRGGIKLTGALDAFGLNVTGAVAADIGASTGGFTDCLLQRGAARVHAVDVGHGQLAWALREDPRVAVIERHNARLPLPIEERVSLATVDVSFISLTLVLPTIVEIMATGGHILALVKPQFEAGRADVRRGGVVRDPL
ncbi:MAG: TlyA family RNA methyltransferase, partial [Chloroflexi bacterium]|nr:TlyA family RNA methyltransferase [Chloroflexota bacterium]